jgi:predicted transcriptional regulator of viral defense system
MGKNSIILVMMSELAGIGKLYRKKLSKVLEGNYSVITSKLVSETLKVSIQESGRLLSRWNKSGWIKRIKRGSYIPVPLESSTNKVILEEPFLVVDSLYAPGYLAGFSAVKHWDFTEQIIESVTFYTLKKIKERNPIHGGIKFKLKTISKYKLFGLKTLWIGSKKIKISDPTKTMIDLLDDPKIVGGITIIIDFYSEYISSEHCDLDLLIQYAQQMKNKTIFKRLGLINELVFNADEKVLSVFLENISSGYSEFDPTVSSEYYISRWKLKTSEFWKNKYDRKK